MRLNLNKEYEEVKMKQKAIIEHAEDIDCQLQVAVNDYKRTKDKIKHKEIEDRKAIEEKYTAKLKVELKEVEKEEEYERKQLMDMIKEFMKEVEAKDLAEFQRVLMTDYPNLEWAIDFMIKY